MNDIQKLAHAIIESLKPLTDAIDQISAVERKPPIETSGLPGLNINIKGMATKAALANPTWHLPDGCDECMKAASTITVTREELDMIIDH